MSAAADIFKAYDVRGRAGADLDAVTAQALGRAAAAELGGPEVAVGRDMRLSSPELAEAFMAGVRRAGVGTVDLGLCSTDMVWFASGRLGVPAAMWTASHNPGEDNGLKLCRAGAVPVSLETGLAAIRDRLAAGELPTADTPGGHRRLDLLHDYAAHVRTFVDPARLAPLVVAVDAGNGMAGLVAPAVFETLPVKLVMLYGELDGTFPHHPPDPLNPGNLADLQAHVLEQACDLGLAFDGDADRVVAVDEQGRVVAPSLVTAAIAERLLDDEPGQTVLYNAICSAVVPETVRRCGGTPQRTRVGHSLIKRAMAETDAAFAGEHSGHYYFRDNFRADSAMIAAVVVLQALSHHGGTLSELLAAYDRYAASGELNRRVRNTERALERVAEAFASEGSADRLDGLTVTGDGWWFNLRPSNTEPMLRLNVEAEQATTMHAVRDRVLALLDD